MGGTFHEKRKAEVFRGEELHEDHAGRKTLAQALATGLIMQRWGLGWRQEKLRADRPWREWQDLAHLLAAVGGNGMLEADANANPLRSMIEDFSLHEGLVVLPNALGLGTPSDEGALRRFLVRQ